jgi:hypothetical protein
VHFKVGFSAVQACKSAGLHFIVPAFWKYLFGKTSIFDHHDVNPELDEAKFGKRGLFWNLLRHSERLTFRIAIDRGGMAAEDVYVVRSIRIWPSSSGSRRRRRCVTAGRM